MSRQRWGKARLVHLSNEFTISSRLNQVRLWSPTSVDIRRTKQNAFCRLSKTSQTLTKFSFFHFYTLSTFIKTTSRTASCKTQAEHFWQCHQPCVLLVTGRSRQWLYKEDLVMFWEAHLKTWEPRPHVLKTWEPLLSLPFSPPLAPSLTLKTSNSVGFMFSKHENSLPKHAKTWPNPPYISIYFNGDVP